MRNIICNLLILGALFISTQYKGQHLLEALDAPSIGVSTPPTDNPILIGGENSCIQQGLIWTGYTCMCSSSTIAIWRRDATGSGGKWDCSGIGVQPPTRGCDPAKEPCNLIY